MYLEVAQNDYNPEIVKLFLRSGFDCFLLNKEQLKLIKKEIEEFFTERSMLLLKLFSCRSLIREKSKIGLLPSGVFREIFNYA